MSIFYEIEFAKYILPYLNEMEDPRYLDALPSLLSLLIDFVREAEIPDEEQVNQLLGLSLASLPNLGELETMCMTVMMLDA